MYKLTFKQKFACLMAFVVILCVAIIPVNFGINTVNAYSDSIVKCQEDASDYILQTHKDVRNDAYQKNSWRSNARVSGEWQLFGESYNASQGALNKSYNKKFGTKYTGTCAQVASAMLANLMLKESGRATKTDQEIFNYALNYSVENNLFNKKETILNRIVFLIPGIVG